jgi:hypothetical protein
MTVALPILETSSTALSFALILRDRLTSADALQGDVTVSAGARQGLQKSGSGTFVFFNLPAGAVTFRVTSAAATPFYRPLVLPLVLPVGSPQWPAYPDIALADPTLPLASPAQPAAYRTQFLACALTPDIAYPFDPGATLVRGIVQSGGAGAAGATVFDVAGAAAPFVTDASGEFVLAWLQSPAVSVAATIRVQRQGHPDIDTNILVSRAATIALVINV